MLKTRPPIFSICSIVAQRLLSFVKLCEARFCQLPKTKDVCNAAVAVNAGFCLFPEIKKETTMRGFFFLEFVKIRCFEFIPVSFHNTSSSPGEVVISDETADNKENHDGSNNAA